MHAKVQLFRERQHDDRFETVVDDSNTVVRSVTKRLARWNPWYQMPDWTLPRVAGDQELKEDNYLLSDWLTDYYQSS